MAASAEPAQAGQQRRRGIRRRPTPHRRTPTNLEYEVNFLKEAAIALKSCLVGIRLSRAARVAIACRTADPLHQEGPVLPRRSHSPEPHRWCSSGRAVVIGKGWRFDARDPAGCLAPSAQTACRWVPAERSPSTTTSALSPPLVSASAVRSGHGAPERRPRLRCGVGSKR